MTGIISQIQTLISYTLFDHFEIYGNAEFFKILNNYVYVLQHLNEGDYFVLNSCFYTNYYSLMKNI